LEDFDALWFHQCFFLTRTAAMEAPSDNLYMSNLPAGITEEMVAEVFSVLGVVKQCRVLPSRREGDASAALVRFQSVQEAEAVVASLNGTTLPGFEEPVNIKFASQKSQGGGGYGKWQDKKETSTPWSGGGGRGSWSEPPPCDNLYIKGLPQGTDDNWLKEALAGLAVVTSVRILTYETTDGTCAALARFASEEDATRVKDTLHGQSPEWCPTMLEVKYAVQKSKGGGKDSGGWSGGKGGGGSGGWSSGGSGKGGGGDGAWSSGGAGGNGGNGMAVDADSLVKMVQEAQVVPAELHHPEATVYVAGLPGDTVHTHVYQLFSPFGSILNITVKNGEAWGKSPPWAIAFVDYVDPLSAQAAIAVYNGMQLPDGTMMKVTIKGSTEQS